MNTIPINQIAVAENRQRKKIDPAKMHELADSIQSNGLLHPIVLRQDEEGRFWLVAGERRLEAVSDIAALGGQIRHDEALVPVGSIPYTLLSDLSPLAIEEAELEENIRREDLTWQERVAAIARLKSLRDRQAVDTGAEPPSLSDIAAELGRGENSGTTSRIREEILLARHLDKPEIAAATSPKEAFKTLKRIEAAERNRALGEFVGRSFTADVHQLFNTDALDWIGKCADGQFDVVLTDPPYGMGADEFGDSGGMATGAHGYGDSASVVEYLITRLPEELFRVTKEQAHAYIFLDIDWFPAWKSQMAIAGWQVFRTPLIWHKPAGMRAPWPEQGPQRKYELCLYAVKGKRPVLKLAGDVLTYGPDANLGHGAQKPVALFEDLLRRSVHPGDSVLDLFCGTGPVFPAAHALKCRATGIELDQSSYGIAAKRIQQLKTQLELGI